jgi:Bacterial protein of unknown function (DUF937)
LQIDRILNDAASSAVIKNLATAFGVDPERATPAVEIMFQALTDRIERNTLSRGGVADVVDLLGKPALGRALNDPQGLASPQVANAGNYVLEVLFGSKHLSRGIAARAAAQTGLDEEVAKRMLPSVASLLIGALQSKAQGEIADKFGGLAAVSGRSPLPLPGERPLNLPDSSTGDFDFDLPKTAGGSGGGMGGATAGSGSPLPIPGDEIPGINDGERAPSRFPQLPDVIRRGGTQVPGPSGGSLEDIIRSILGNLLGFKNGGIMSWIINLLLSKWFVGFVMRIVRRMLTGR